MLIITPLTYYIERFSRVKILLIFFLASLEAIKLFRPDFRHILTGTNILRLGFLFRKYVPKLQGLFLVLILNMLYSFYKTDPATEKSRRDE